MQRRVRRFLLASLLALYGATTVLGPALHELPGAASHARLGGAASGHSSGSDDCPVCHFLAQGGLADDPARIPSLDVALVRPADALPLIVPAAVSRPSDPRAPPRA